MARYAKTIKDLAAELGVKRDTIYAYKRQSGFPPRRKSGWNVEHVQRFINESQSAKQKARKARGTMIDDLRAEKIQIDIDMGNINLERLRGSLISTDDHLAAFREYAGYVNQTLDQWVSWISATTRDKRQVEKAKELRDRALTFLRGKIDGTNGH